MWVPFPGAQEDFCSRGEFEALYGGAAGPGKTDCLVALATRQINHPAYSAILMRRTFPQLQEIIDRSHQQYPAIGGIYRSTEHRWYFPSGAKIQLGHMQHENDKYNYQGKQYQFIGFDELTHFSKEQYLYLFSRCRSSIPGLDAEMRSSTNPGGIGHTWVKERFVDVAPHGDTYIDPDTGLSRVFIPGKLTDNPALMENDPGYLARLKALPEIEQKRLIEGIWDAFEGQVFTELSARVHRIADFDPPPEWFKWCTFDWGYAKPFCCLWFAIDPDGVIYLYREWYGCEEGKDDTGLKLGTTEIANGIHEREREKINIRLADPAIWSGTPEKQKYGIKGNSIWEDLTASGLHFLKADNDRKQGKTQVHKRFEVEEIVDERTGEIISERPRFYATESCKHFWRTIPLLREDAKNPEDVDTKQEDHIYDCVRYGFMFKPIVVKRKQFTPQGTFTKERERMIRARNYAKRNGCTMEDAYRRIK
jgi:hypothetical protein